MSHPRHLHQPALRLKLGSTLLSIGLSAALGATTLAPLAWAQPATEQLEYNIAAGPLGTALSQFAATSAVTLSFASTQTQGLLSPGIQGRYSFDEGIAHLLANSGLQVRQEGVDRYSLIETQGGSRWSWAQPISRVPFWVPRPRAANPTPQAPCRPRPSWP